MIISRNLKPLVMVFETGINTADAFAGFDYLKAPHGTTVNYAVTVAAKTAAHRYNVG